MERGTIRGAVRSAVVPGLAGTVSCLVAWVVGWLWMVPAYGAGEVMAKYLGVAMSEEACKRAASQRVRPWLAGLWFGIIETALFYVPAMGSRQLGAGEVAMVLIARMVLSVPLHVGTAILARTSRWGFVLAVAAHATYNVVLTLGAGSRFAAFDVTVLTYSAVPLLVPVARALARPPHASGGRPLRWSRSDGS